MVYSNNRTLNRKEKDGKKNKLFSTTWITKVFGKLRANSAKYLIYETILNLRKQMQTNAQYIILCTKKLKIYWV